VSREYYKYYNQSFEKIPTKKEFIKEDSVKEKSIESNPILDIFDFKNEEIILGIILLFLLMEDDKDMVMIAIIAFLLLNK
jgi:hypothetical protein